MNANPRRRPPPPGVTTEPDAADAAPGRRAGLGAVAVLGVAVALAALVWPRLADSVSRDEAAILLPEAVELRGQAPWVKADIRAEALRGASLDRGLPLHDPELANRLARAFDMHPWVRRVVRVDLRHPAGATVEIECREPAAMVGVSGGLLAVDGEGVVLPSGDFTAESAATYPRLAGIDSSPQGPEGARWGDPAVEEGAALAQVIAPEWIALRLTECRPVDAAGRRSWEFVDGDGRTIVFGSAPGREAPGEPTAAAKIALLRRLPEGGGERVDLSLPAPAP